MFLENKFKIYKLDPAKFLSDSGLEWLAAALKNTEVKLGLSTDMICY